MYRERVVREMDSKKGRTILHRGFSLKWPTITNATTDVATIITTTTIERN